MIINRRTTERPRTILPSAVPRPVSPAPAPAVPVEPEPAPSLDARVAVENILDSCIAIEKAGRKIEEDIAQGRIHGDLDKPFIDMLSPAITGMIDTARRVDDPGLQKRIAAMADEECAA